MKRGYLQKLVTIVAALMVFSVSSIGQNGWQQVFFAENVFMRDICFVPGADGAWQTGWAIAAEGYIYKTTDGGTTWTTYTQNHSTILGGISFADENTGYICTLDTYQILKSTDGGETWTVSYTGTEGFDKIAFKDTQNGVASGTFKVYTSDGGATWQDGTGGNSYWDMDYAGGNTYYGVYLGGNLGKSTDNGATWSNVESLDQMAFMTKWLDESNGMFGGDLSKLMVTEDGGSSWFTNTLGDGQDAINTGGFFDADTLYAWGSTGDFFKSTNSGEDWDLDTSFSNFNPRGFVVTDYNAMYATGWYGSDGMIWRKYGSPPFGADFNASDTLICKGSSVDFTDLSIGDIISYNWVFEGGSPSTSTEQNPAVTYNSTGLYNVSLTISDGNLTETKTKTNYITVYETPAQADMPAGESEICTEESYDYSIPAVEFAQEYEWAIDPEEAGTFDINGNMATLMAAEDWTGSFAIKVRAVNLCGNGDWSDELEGTLYQNALLYNLEGGGGYCLNGEGSEITLSDSDAGIEYELFLGAETTGVIVEGTGSPISFGLFTDEGYYTCKASNGNCIRTMENQVEIFNLYPPDEPSAPTGPETVCSTDTSEYNSDGADGAESYVWELFPENAGSLTPDGLNAFVNWNSEFSGTATISIEGVNNCGPGMSSTLEIQVLAMPAPVITGEVVICDFQSEDYSVEETSGSTYTWIVTGGNVVLGQGTHTVTIEWGMSGSGTIAVEEQTAESCMGSSETFNVMIDDCTVVDELFTNTGIDVYPNPATNVVHIIFNRPLKDLTEILIMNQFGQLLLSESNLQKKSSDVLILDLSTYVKGIYIIQIRENGNLLASKKLIKN